MMPDDNPFRRGPGPGPGPKPVDDSRPTEEPPTEKPPPGTLCPFLGAIVIPKVNPRAVSLIHRNDFNPLEAFEPGITIMPCQRELCAMWDADDSDCTIKIGAQSQIDSLAVLEEIKTGLEPLAGFFGGRK